MGGGRGRRQWRQQLRLEQVRSANRGSEPLPDPVVVSVREVVAGSAACALPDPLADPVAAVRSMPGEVSRQGLHVLARDLIEQELPDGYLGEEPLEDTAEDRAEDTAEDTAEAEDGAVDTAQPAEEDLAGAGADPGDGVREDARQDADAAEEAPGSGLGRVVDVFVGARRLAGWSLWLQLAAAAHLIARWQSSPPIVQGAFDAPDPSDPRSRGLAQRLWRVVSDLEIWGPVQTGDLAEAFVASEIAAAAGLSHYGAGQLVDAARALFMSPRLPRTRALLRAGLLDWTKLCTILSATAALADEVCALVEAAVISDADLAVAEPLDVLADPTRPGAPLPALARVNNPTLRAQLHAATAAIDAEAANRRAGKARAERTVWGTPQPDGMGKLELITGQEQVAAILTGLDQAAAAGKAAGDPRRMNQIRCDHAVHLLTDGAFAEPAPTRPPRPQTTPTHPRTSPTHPPTSPASPASPAGPVAGRARGSGGGCRCG
jgi:hypothetical protein